MNLSRKKRTLSMFRRNLVESLEQRAVMDSTGFSALVPETSVAPQGDALQRFASEQELVSAFKQRLNTQYSGLFGQLVYSPIWQYDPLVEFAIDDSHVLMFASSGSDANVARPIVASLDSVHATGTRSASSTSTNNQIDGIDEGDIAEITSDGIVYTATEGRLTIVDASDPENIIALSNIDIGLCNAQLILLGNRLIVVSPSSAASMTPWFDRVTPTWTTQLRVFDVSDKAHPKQTADMQWEGSASAVRLVGDKLVMVLNHNVDLAPRIISSPSSAVSSTGPLSPFVTRRIGDDGAGLITMDCMWYDPNARYESEEDYWARVEPLIVSSLLPNYEIHDETGAVQSYGDAGDVHDIVALTTLVPYWAESVITIDVSSSTPRVIDSETLLDDMSQSAYVSSDSVYFFSNIVWPETRFIKLDWSDDEGQVTAVAEGSVPGIVRDSHSIDEYDGMLRVMTGNAGLNWANPSTADLFVLKEIDGELQTIGELRDIADGQEAFSIEFDGTRAVIVTAEVDRSTLVPFNDPVHGIDLSDPTAPKELGEIESPGVTTYLHWLDAQHLIGAGYVQQDGNWSLQIALIDATDLASPKIQDVWHSEPNAWVPWGNLTIDPHTFQFDDVSGILTITYQSNRPVWFGNVWSLSTVLSTDTQDADSANSLVVFHVNTDGINELGTIQVRDTARTAVVDDSLIVVSTQSVATYAINANLSLLDRYQLTSPTAVDYVTTNAGEPVIVDVLENDADAGALTMTTVSQSNRGGQIKQLDDGRVEYTPPQTSSDTSLQFGYIDSFNYTVTTTDGRSFIGVVFVTVLPVDDPQAAGKAALSVDVKDDAGNAVTSISAGSEFWVELSAQDLRTDPQGIYAAFFDVQFDTSAFEVVGDAEAMGTFVNGRTGTHGEGGWKDLGGFTDSTSPLGAGPQSVVRFKLRALRDEALTISVSPASGSAQETLLFGSNVPVTPSNISSSIVTIPAIAEVSSDATLLATLQRYDVSGDDRLSPLDVLLVINRINEVMQGPTIVSLAETDSAGESSNAFDVNVDGKISPLDALLIINQLNGSSESTARLQSTATSPWIDISVLRTAVTAQASFKSASMAMSGEGESGEQLQRSEAEPLSDQVISGNVQSAASWSSAVDHTIADSETFAFEWVESRSRSSRSIRNSLASRN